jgi:hypothetical protein
MTQPRITIEDSCDLPEAVVPLIQRLFADHHASDCEERHLVGISVAVEFFWYSRLPKVALRFSIVR